MVDVMVTKMMVGRTEGTVIETNCRNRPAPSMIAASYSSRGMACIAASRTSVLNPVQRKFTIVAIATWAGRLSRCQPIASAPTSSRTALTSPDWSAKRREKMRVTATGATTYGSSTPMRQNVLARMLALRTLARTRAMAICGTVDSTKMLSVLPRETQNTGRLRTNVKLPKPTKSPCPLIRSQSWSET